MIESIELRRAVPVIFADDREYASRRSDIWLRESIEFRRGRSYILEAESGMGKSSLISYIYGVRTDFRGDILIGGESIRHFDIGKWCELRTHSLAYLPQEMRLFPELTAMENIRIKNRLTGMYSDTEILERLERLELGAKADTPAARLSIGQQQRVAIIRALCQPFDFLLADEPVSHLDARNNAAVAALIADEAAARGAAIIATSVGNKLSLPTFTLLSL